MTINGPDKLDMLDLIYTPHFYGWTFSFNTALRISTNCTHSLSNVGLYMKTKHTFLQEIRNKVTKSKHDFYASRKYVISSNVGFRGGVPYILPRNTYRNYKYVNIT